MALLRRQTAPRELRFVVSSDQFTKRCPSPPIRHLSALGISAACYFFASLKVAITLAFVGTTVSEMTASNEDIGYLLISAGSSMQMGLAFAGLVVIGVMAMVMYELFAVVEKRTTGWAHRGAH